MPTLDDAAPLIPQPLAMPQCETDLDAQLATADYVMDLSAELSGMASGAGLALLSRLLDLVQLEAKRIKGERPL